MRLNKVLDLAAVAGLLILLLIKAARFPNPATLSDLVMPVAGIVLGVTVAGMLMAVAWVIPRKSIKDQNEALKEFLEYNEQKQRQANSNR